MNKIFDPDNWFWRGFGRLADYFLLTMAWLTCCIPVVTAGAATAALFETASCCIRGGEDDLMKHFFRTLKKKLLRGILLTLLWAVPLFLLSWGWQILGYLAESASLWRVFRIAYLVTLAVPAAGLTWAVAILGRFDCPVGQLHRKALAFALRDIPRSAAMAAILAASLAVIRYVPYLLLFIPAVTAHLQSALAEKTFQEETLREGTEEY